MGILDILESVQSGELNNKLEKLANAALRVNAISEILAEKNGVTEKDIQAKIDEITNRKPDIEPNGGD